MKKEELKVLILEDVRSDAELVKLQFEVMDFDPSFVVTDKENEYVDLLTSFNPDLIISDFNLPRFDGLKALKILRDYDPVTPFIFVTGTLGEENAVRAIKTGASDFINKNQIHLLPAAIVRAMRELGEVKSKIEYMNQMQENEKRFEALVQSGSEFIATVSTDGDFLFNSNNYSKLLGYSLDEIRGTSIFSFIHQDDISVFMEAFKGVKGKDVVIVEPYRFRNAFNQWRWHQCTITNQLRQPSINGLIVNSQDITTLLQREKELELSNERYRLASIATQDIIYDWDLESGQTSRDENVVKNLLGYDSSVSRSIHFWKEHVHPDDMEEAFDRLFLELENPKSTFCEHEYRFMRSDGSYAYLHDKGFIIRNDEGKAIRLIGATRDISDQKNQERMKDLLLSISAVMGLADSLKNSLKRVAKLLREFTGVTLVEVWLPSAFGEYVSLATYELDPKEEIDKYKNYLQIQRMELGDGIVGLIWETGAVHHWGSIGGEKRFARGKEARALGLESAYGQPLMHGDEVIGVIMFINQREKGIMERLQGTLGPISHQLAPEIRRRRSEEELNNFFELSADLLCILGSDGLLKRVNPAFSGNLGFSEEDFLSRHFLEFVYQPDRLETEREFDHLLTGMATNHFENRYITKSGVVKWISWSASYSKEMNVIMAVGKDITEKKKLERLIQASHKLAKMGSWELDMIKNRLYWTPMTKEIHEVSQDYEPNLEEAINFYKEGKDREAVSNGVQMAIEGGRPWDLELQIITAKGNEKWVRAIGGAEMVDGKCVRLYGSFQDIDEKKRVEKELLESNERFELASKAALEAIYEWEVNTERVFWTEGYKRLFGYEPGRSTLSQWKKKINEMDEVRIMRSLDEAFSRAGEQFWSGEYRFKRKNGSMAIVEDRGYITRDEQGKPVKMIGVVADVTEERRFREKLLENTIQSQEAERNRLARELHDGIVQEMVACGMKSDSLKSYLGNEIALQDQIDTLTEYIKKITLDTRDVSHNLMSADMSNMTFAELLDQLSQTLNSISKIEFDIRHDLGELSLEEDVKVNLYRVIQELANNIIKHSEASEALVMVYLDKSILIVNVSDNGKGISESEKSREGIGLSNIRSRINSIGGSLKFVNRKKSGLTVEITVQIETHG